MYVLIIAEHGSIIVVMKLTKYSHACFVAHLDNQSVVIDPGGWSADFKVPEDVVGIVVTHEHADHLDLERLQSIQAVCPDAIIYAHERVTAHITGLNAQPVTTGKIVHVGDFALEFVGGEHAEIHSSFPHIANLGVMINDLVYYPGDSFELPSRPVEVLAIPAAAPWMKISEAMDFLDKVRPSAVFPTHDFILSDTGQRLADQLLMNVAEQIGANYIRIKPGETVDASKLLETTVEP